MKNLLCATVFILFSFFQLSANNAPEKAVLDVVLNEKSVVLKSTMRTEEMTFIITDQFGESVFIDKIEENKTRVKYDLKALPSGDYIFKIQSENSIKIYEALISDDKVSLVNHKSFFRPMIQNMVRKVIVTSEYLNDEDIQVSIFDNSDVLVYRLNDQNTGAFQKIFNLKELPLGDYTVMVSTDYFSNSTKISL